MSAAHCSGPRAWLLPGLRQPNGPVGTGERLEPQPGLAPDLLRKFSCFLTTSLIFGADTASMRVHGGRAIAVGLLCVVAATVALWSGPLLSASSAMHSAPASATAGATIQTHGSAR